MPKTIVAIGGGLIRTRSTEAIDREIIRLSKKKRPRALLIPTASSDHPLYWERFQKYFGGYLQCATDVLYLIKEHPAPTEIRRKIGAADIIYVGGGNTLLMMRLWRSLGVDRLLKRAYEQGTVLSGISAGSICWFASGHSDSMSFYNRKKWDYINVKGLGLIKGIHCPHYDGKTLGSLRRRDFQQMIEKTGGVGIALENNCAIKFVDRGYAVISAKERANAYRVFKRDGKVVSRRIPKQKHLAPIASLFDVS
jgi:dipeptidase E